MNRKYVIVGPHRTARKYAEARNWNNDDFIIVTRGHQLAQLDPALMRQIVTVKLHTMGQRIMEEIHEAIEQIRALWPVPTMAAA